MITRVESFESLLTFDAASTGATPGQFGFWSGMGWHFYSLLKISDSRMKGDDKRDVRRVVKVYTNYSKAAVAAQLFCGKELGVSCEILEHQGTVIHFYFPNSTSDAKSSIVRFAKVLSKLVDKYVRYYYDDVTQCHMGAEFGKSVLVKSPSLGSGTSSDTLISLGPSANNPAHKMGESKKGVRRPLWLRASADCRWDCEECYSDDDVAGLDFNHSIEGLEFSFDDRLLTESLLDERNLPVSRFAFFFRADMDGFTKKIATAFATNSVASVVKDFCEYMTDANQWQIQTDLRVSPHPWSGDCFNALIEPTSSELGELEEKFRRKQFPLRIVEEWERYVAGKLYRGGAWVYAVSGGNVYTFSVNAGRRLFKLSVGRPVGLTLYEVTLSGATARDLIMHMEEVQYLSPEAQESFMTFSNDLHFRYRRQNGADRDLLSARSIVPYVKHQQIPPWKMVLAYDVTLSAFMRRTHTSNVWRTISSWDLVPKCMDLQFRACTNVPPPYSVKWQVTNNGYEAASARQLRGGFDEPSQGDILGLRRDETTRYTGQHWVYCYVLKDGKCVARSLPFVVRVP